MAETFQLEELAAFTPSELVWAELPERCIVQLHWPRSEQFRALLHNHGFRICVLMRDPIDVLVSILHFATHEPETARWIGGAYGDERAIVGIEPCSGEFVQYATGPRARALIAISQQWWTRDAMVRVRFEQLVTNPARELERIAARSNIHPRMAIDRAIEMLEFSKVQREAPKEHYWQGKPGLWRRLLAPEYAVPLAATYRRSASRYGYRLEPDYTLSATAAREEWHRLTSRAPDLHHRQPEHGVA